MKDKWRIIAAAAAVVGTICILFLCFFLVQRSAAWKKHQQMVEDFTETVEETVDTTEAFETQTDEAVTEPVKPEIPVDFAALQDINEDIFGWIRIPGTEIDYPLLCSAEDDQSYYLDHDMYGKKSKDASIYIENYNSIDMSDSNTVIYGHNWSSGGMFHELEGYQNEDFFKEHSEIVIYLPDRVLTYEVVSAYHYDDRHLLYSFDFYDPEVFEEYLETVMHPEDANAHVKEGVTLTADDRIITLSTCVIGKGDMRLLVQAVLRSEDKI